MEHVSFITTEIGGDLIVSFAVQIPYDPMDIRSLTFLRTPKYEFIFDDDERGVSVSFEHHRDDEGDRLEEVRYSPEKQTVRLKTRKRTFLLDVRKVDPDELAQMRKVFHKMNFDGRLRLTGI